jgi:hypothetical protein
LRFILDAKTDTNASRKSTCENRELGSPSDMKKHGFLSSPLSVNDVFAW